MKSTIASNAPIGDRDSNRAVAGHEGRHVRGHAPWSQANRAIGSRSVLAFMRGVGICRLFLSNVLLETTRSAGEGILYAKTARSDTRDSAMISLFIGKKQSGVTLAPPLTAGVFHSRSNHTTANTPEVRLRSFDEPAHRPPLR